MKILYISSACKKENKKLIDKTAKIKLTMSIIKFHNLIIDGLSECEGIEIESLIGLPISILTNRKIFWKAKVEKEKNKIYNQVNFINIPIVKQISIMINIEKELIKWIKENRRTEKKIIIIDGTFVSVLPKVCKVANKYNVKVVGVFADIYDYMCDVDNESNKSNIIKKIYRKKMDKCYDFMCAYVFLTEYMNALINIANKPYIIMEGVVDGKIDSSKTIDKFSKKTVMYAGKLQKKYGLKHFLEAFQQITGDYEAIVCGDGELKQYVENIAQKDTRVKYLGMIPNEKVMEYEEKSNVLINPRFTDEEYTKYSFPSKNMEYMASGTPILTTKLLGMPEEYYDYVYLIEDETVEGMKDTLKLILAKTEGELNNQGKRAQEFVLNKKNNVIQAKRIIKLLEKM